MKFILRFLIFGFLAIIRAPLFAADSAQIETEIKRIEILRRALDDGGVGAMLATGISSPLIRSQYYVDKLATLEPELRVLEQAKRDFGLKLAQTLDSQAAQLQKRRDSAERAKQAALLLDLADWLRTSTGYGNYVLFSRSESLATVPLVYLTADLDYPLTSVTAMRVRILPRATERAFRVAVLNDEAPKPFIVSLRGSDSDQDEQIQIAWGKGWHAMEGQFKSRGVMIGDWHREKLPEEQAFFLDDEHTPEPRTTVNLWNFKRHSTLIFGHRDVLVRSLDEFMLYREKVGMFPTQPPKWWNPNQANSSDTALRTAFQEAAKNLRRENGQPFGYSAAAMLYQQAIDGQVVDYETELVRSMRETKRTQSGK